MDGTFASEFWFGTLFLEWFDGIAVSCKGFAFADFRAGVWVAEVNAVIAFGELNVAPLLRLGRTVATSSLNDFVVSPVSITEFCAGFIWEVEPKVSNETVLFEHRQALWKAIT
jgi:hypothetical protein